VTGRDGAFGTLFSSLSLARKVALIPGLTLLLMGLMLAVAVRMGDRNTAALRGLDSDVFEPLSRAQTLKDEITLLHTHLYALLSLGTNEVDPVAQKTKAAALVSALAAEARSVNQLLDISSAVPPPDAARLRTAFAAYAARARQAAEFAAYDGSYGALLAGGASDEFSRLRGDLDDLVSMLALRRAALADRAVGASLNARRLLVGLGVGATILALLGSIVVGHGIARPVQRLTGLMNRLASGDTDMAVPDTGRHDEVGAMARAVEVFRGDAIARRQGEIALLSTNQQFDLALNSMLQGLLVWSPDFRLQLVNRRLFSIFDLPAGSIQSGMTVRETIEVLASHGLYSGADLGKISDGITTLLITRQSRQFEREIRPGLFVRITREPIANGGAVVTVEDVTEKHRKDREIAFLARHDTLTGLPNRVMFQEHLAEAVEHLGEGRQFTVLCLDLDRFKEVNDTLGHAAGDELLRLVAGRLRLCVRGSDLIARLGGDEFSIVLSNEAGGKASARKLASRLVDSIGAPYSIEGHSIVIGTSVGIALSEPGVPAAELLKRADVALYRAKAERGTFVFHEPRMDEHLLAQRELETDLRLAVQRDEFELDFQPIYSLTEDRVTGFEALVRWNSPTRGRVSPGHFIPLSERTGLIVPIGAWVLRTACAEAARWPDHVRVAINLSPVQFRDKRLAETIRETLRDTGLRAERLELEITETVLLQDTDAVMTVLRGLHDLHVRVAMDDFGTGFSSLSYLHRFPFDKIKIDQSFIKDLRATPLDGTGATVTDGTPSSVSVSAAMIVRAIIGLGENLGITTTAEGVETAEQLARIRREGCTEAQGYFISPPRPSSEVPALLRRLDAAMPEITGGRRAVALRVA